MIRGTSAAQLRSKQDSEGLRYAHGLGYLHRDIKPENIWVTTEGDIKLLDFGLARAVNETTNLTNTGTILGTPSYMSPEQVPVFSVQGARTGLQIWKLDSQAGSLSLAKVFPSAQGKWHLTEPTISWIRRNGIVNWYNVETDQLISNDAVDSPRGVVPIPGGWLVVGPTKMVEFDLNLNVKKTYLSTKPTGPTNATGYIDQCITADGEILKSDTKSYLNAIQLRDNRFETLTVEEFERQSP